MTKLFTVSVRERPASLQRICTREKLYSCDECGSLSTQSGNLKKHIKIHTGENLFTYRKYGNAFTLSGSLSRHQQIHMVERSSSCDQCGSVFTQSGSLKIHMCIHSGEEPYSSNQCGKRLTVPKTFRVEMQIKSWLERNSTCVMNIELLWCFYVPLDDLSHPRKPFTQKGTLVCHMLVQAGNRPHWGKECKTLSGKGWI